MAAGFQRFVDNHPIMVSGLGLAPLLAPARSLMSGIGMGLAFAVLLLLCVLIIGALRRAIPWNARLPFILLITATSVTVLDRLMQAWLFDLHAELGIYLPLLAVNTLILATLEESVLGRPLRRSLAPAAVTAVAAFLLVAATGLLRGGLASAGLALMDSAAAAFLIIGCLIAGLRCLALRRTAA